MKSRPNKKNIRQWVEALRGGKYKQGREALYRVDNGGFCCLGVACDLYIKDTKQGEWTENPNSSWRFLFDSGNGKIEQTDAVWLPPVVQDWLGILHCDPYLETALGKQQCGELNDKKQWDFDQIADAIERTYLSEDAV